MGCKGCGSGKSVSQKTRSEAMVGKTVVLNGVKLEIKKENGKFLAEKV